MNRRNIAIALLTFIFVFSELIDAKAKVHRMGLLFPGSLSYGAPLIEAFREGLRQLGYIEGNNIIIEYRIAEGKSDRYFYLATELVNLKVDLIVTASTPAIKAVRQVTRTIPIVMAAAADPVRTGLIASLANPGANVTGLSMRSPEISGKRLELIKTIAPKTQRIGILLTADNTASETSLQDSQIAARGIGLELQPVKIHGPSDIDKGLRELRGGRIDAFTLFRESVLLVHANRILQLARNNRLPAVYDGREFALSGGLMSYTPNHIDLWKRAATYVDRIFKGARPADLPVEQTMRAEFIVNLRAANEIGLSIPLELIQQADQVIQR